MVGRKSSRRGSGRSSLVVRDVNQEKLVMPNNILQLQDRKVLVESRLEELTWSFSRYSVILSSSQWKGA